jgi:dihydroxyacetone kinase-like protein
MDDNSYPQKPLAAADAGAAVQSSQVDDDIAGRDRTWTAGPHGIGATAHTTPSAGERMPDLWQAPGLTPALGWAGSDPNPGYPVPVPAATGMGTGPPHHSVRMQGEPVDIALARAWVQAIAAAIDEQTDYLTQLDSAIGDADHGVNMRRGFTTVLAVLADLQPRTVGDVLGKTGSTLISSVGGAAGPLYGSAFRAIGQALDEPVTGNKQLLGALTDGLAAIQRLGAAVAGDKTIVDAYAPAVAAFEQSLGRGDDLTTATASAAAAAEEGMRATTSLQARKGRASYLGVRSIGHQDPGATSTALIFRALAEVVAAG